MKNLILLSLMAIALSATAWINKAAPFEIKGKVTDSNGEMMIGASVLIKGTTIGAITDVNGFFSLKSRDSCVTLEVSYTGYSSVLHPNACASQTVTIVLAESTMHLDEVVVLGAPKQRRKDKGAAAKQATPGFYNWSSDQPSLQTEDYDVINENRFLETRENPLSTFSIDVDAASYSNMRRFLNNGQLPPKDAVRIEEMINYFHYDYPQPKRETPFEVITELGDYPGRPQHKLLHIALQGLKIPTDNLPPSNLVFLIDVSGSMMDLNKLPLLQSSFKLLVDQLRPKDRVALVVYAGAAGLVLESTPGDEKIKIKKAIDQLQAGGSTAGGEGIQLAYEVARKNFAKEGNNRVILATDGDFNVGASSDAEMVRMIEKERESGIFLTVLGFGMGNYKDNKMQQLADKGNGNHAYIDNLSEAQKVLVNEFGGTLFIIAKDVKIQIEFNPAKVKGYRLIGYENRLLNKEDFNDDKKDAGELGSGHTVTALYEIIPTGVESPYLADVNELKYQKTETTAKGNEQTEWATVNLRYKNPEGGSSKMITEVVNNSSLQAENSDNFRWAAAMAHFGMLLRQSEYKGDMTYEKLIKLAQSAKGKDEEGYRAECIKLIQLAAGLQQ